MRQSDRSFRASLVPRSLAAAVAVASLGVGLAPATSAAAAIEEIVVQARKRSESLQEVPIAVTAITESTIENAGIERPQDFIALTPNVFMADTANIGDTQVSIRGIYSTRDAESTFAYVVDGVLLTNPNSFNRELVDVAQIEILKGPQGALYGRNAVAGAILVTTKEPTDEFEGRIVGGYGNNDAYRLQGIFSGPITEDISGRFAISQRETDGNFKNRFTRRDNAVDFLEDTTAHGRLLWDVNDRLTLDLTGNVSQAEGGAINFNAAFALPGFAAAFGNPDFNLDVNDHEFQYIFNTPQGNEQESFDLSLKADYSFDQADLTVILAYNDLEESLLSDGTSAAFGGYALDFVNGSNAATQSCFATTNADNAAFVTSPFFAIPGDPVNSVLPPYSPTTCDGYQYQERNQQDFSLEARLTSTGDGPIRWIAGVYLAQLEREVVVAYGADLGLGFEESPFVGPRGPNPTDLLFDDRFDTDIYSVFGSVELDLTETQELSLALRYDIEEREVSNNVPNTTSAFLFGGGAPINPGFADPANVVNGRLRGRTASFDQLQPKISWNWLASDNVSVYASYGLGFRSGGFNGLGTQALIDQNFNVAPVNAGLNVQDEYAKEISAAMELGAKSQWLDRRLTVNAAVFRTDIIDNQFFEFFAGPFGLLRVVTTIDEVQLNGFEIDANYKVTDGWSVYAAYGYLDGEIEENRNRPVTEGNEVPWAPEFTFNAGTEYSREIGMGIEMVARLDWQRLGETWFHTIQEDTATSFFENFFPTLSTGDYSRTRRDAFDTVNGRFTVRGEYWAISAWARNLFDEDFLEEVIVAPEFGGSFIHQGQPRTYGLDLTWNF